MPEKVVSECISKDCKSIAYTYSEPVTFYEYAYDTAFLAKKAGIKNIFKSNGYIYPEPLKKLCSVLDAANIDLKAFNESTYLKLSGGKLQPVLDSLKIYRDMGVWLEICAGGLVKTVSKKSRYISAGFTLLTNWSNSLPLRSIFLTKQHRQLLRRD
jgi:pyruvate-formate lyase-activating enzyme